LGGWLGTGRFSSRCFDGGRGAGGIRTRVSWEARGYWGKKFRWVVNRHDGLAWRRTISATRTRAGVSLTTPVRLETFCYSRTVRKSKPPHPIGLPERSRSRGGGRPKRVRRGHSRGAAGRTPFDDAAQILQAIDDPWELRGATPMLPGGEVDQKPGAVQSIPHRDEHAGRLALRPLLAAAA
jgi:hypothetical protein